jgi:hypothetical protein
MSRHKPASLRRKNKLKQKRKAYRARKRSTSTPASNDGK